MKSLKSLKINWLRVSSGGGGRAFGFGESPQSDWKILFFFLAALSLGIVLWSAFMFVKTDRIETFVVATPTPTSGKILDLDLLRSTISYYQEKEAEFERRLLVDEN